MLTLTSSEPDMNRPINKELPCFARNMLPQRGIMPCQTRDETFQRYLELTSNLKKRQQTWELGNEARQKRNSMMTRVEPMKAFENFFRITAELQQQHVR